MKGQRLRWQFLYWADQNEVSPRPSSRQFFKNVFDLVRASFHFIHPTYVRYGHWLLLNQFPFPHRWHSPFCNQESGSHKPHELLLSVLQKETVFITTKQLPGQFCASLLSLKYIKYIIWSNNNAGILGGRMDFPLSLPLRRGCFWMLFPMIPH